MATNNANQIAAVIVTFLPYFIISIGCGVVSHLIARKKGYSGYFWTGFFLWAFGVMYIASLPVSSALTTPSLSVEEQQLLEQYRILDYTGKKMLHETLDTQTARVKEIYHVSSEK